MARLFDTTLSPCSIHVSDVVYYVPNHVIDMAKSTTGFIDFSHPDIERGIVSSWNPTYCFVRYGSEIHAKATAWANLFHPGGVPSHD